MAEVSSQTLHIVARELTSELNDGRAALEAFGEQQDNVALLKKCHEHLRSVHGALRIAEVYGAALLAEEMGQVARYLIDNFGDRRHLAEGLDALMRAMVQLPTYLERVMSGGRDMALVLLPLLNDLRAVRGHALLSEGTLLLLNLSSDKQANPVQSAGDPPLTVAQWARKLRTRFQLGLLGWIKGERIDQNLEILSRAAEKLEQVATTQPVFQLWWVVGAVLEALREGGLEGTASVKRLLGQADREMKRLYDLGEARYANSPALELLNNLLYYVARARTNGSRVAAVRASFRLSELLPIDDDIEQARESLSAPSVKLMKTVAAAIKEDLGRVKDALDIFVRQGGTQVDELAPQLDLLKKIADTLGVLGLGELRDKVQAETAGLQEIVAQRTPADEGTLLRMAATLIKVEDSLDEQLVSMIVPTPGQASEQRAPAGPEDIEFRQVTEAVLRECIVNMARIKEAIAHTFEKPRETQALDQIPQLVRGITAGLLMLGKTRAVEIMEGIGRAVSQFVRTDGMTLPPEAVDRLADAIVAVEYYMETLQAGRADPWYMLDNAEACLKFLADAQPIPESEALHLGDHARTIVIEPLSQTVAAPTEHEPTAVLDPSALSRVSAFKPPPATPSPSAPVMSKGEREIDPEFLELFIEEAKDEIVKLNELFPRWDENPADHDALVNVRRSFHTLKGSGRMVGAQLIGEFAWAIENMLNRVINKTLDRTPDMMSLLREAVAAVPQLVEQLESGRDPGVDVAKLINRANAIAGVRPSAPSQAQPQAATQPTAPPAQRAVEQTAPAGADARSAQDTQKKTQQAASTPPIDPALKEIYAKETAGHLATIREFIARAEAASPPYPVTEALHRSCHTLNGSAKTAGARQGIKVAEPLNRYVRKLYDNSIGLSQSGLEVLKDAVVAIQQVLDHIDESTGFFLSHPRIIARLGELEQEVDAEIARRAEAASATSAHPTLEPSQEPDLLNETVERPMPPDLGGETLERPIPPDLAGETLVRPMPSDPAGETLVRPIPPGVDGTSAPPPDESEVIELEPTDPGALDLLEWSYENFPPEGQPSVPEGTSGEATHVEETLAEEIELGSSEEEGETAIQPALSDEATRVQPALSSEATRIQPALAAQATNIQRALESPESEPEAASGEEVSAPSDESALPELEAQVQEEPAAAEEVVELSSSAESDEAASALSSDSQVEEPADVQPSPAPEAARSEPPAAPQVAPTPASEPVQESEDFDPEVAAIFTEEATELLETADRSLSAWMRDRANSSLIFELKRALHTLKGGARMAGIRAMGDLSHELETFMQSVEAGQITAEQPAFDALQASLDELHRMRDIVAQGSQ
ncbi:MAG TPA: Hpt domain-containing protein, partial [Steroidobacter sp.]